MTLDPVNFTELRSKLSAISNHLASLFDSIFSAVNDCNTNLKYSFGALSLRELLREFFSVISPDDSIRNCSWWEPSVVDDPEKITRRDRIIFSVYKFVTPSHFEEVDYMVIEALAKKIVKNIDLLSKQVHITESIVASSINNKEKLHDILVKSINDFKLLIEQIENFRSIIEEKLSEIIYHQLDNDTVFDWAINELDILSTHTRVDEVSVDEIYVTSIDRDYIYFSGSGTVSCELQYGSDSDVSNDNGYVTSDSYPMEISGKIDVTEIKYIELVSVSVNTSSFYGIDEDDC